MRHLDLFSGIGGFALAARNVGWETVGFCEIEPYCRRVLRKHWPDVPIYEDVRELRGETVGNVGIITGGFPCQDVSLAGRRAGLEGSRSGLWSEFSRIIGEVRPDFVVVENTPGLLSLGMGAVLGDLATLGYDAEWNCIPACYVGADHIRDRVWIVAYPADWQSIDVRWTNEQPAEVAEDAANSVRSGLQRRLHTGANSEDARNIESRPRLTFDAPPTFSRQYREHQPVLGGGIHGVPDRVDRVKALGNAIVHQVAEVIFRAIDEVDTDQTDQ